MYRSVILKPQNLLENWFYKVSKKIIVVLTNLNKINSLFILLYKCLKFRTFKVLLSKAKL